MVNLNKQISLSTLLCALLFVFPFFVSSENNDLPEVITYTSDNVTNQIPYFDNRFRIDENIEALKLIFYRKRGSQPIILVKPDGTKLKINDLPEDGSIQWFDDETFDMVNIKKPMAGPWQAIGRILPGSQILIVTDVVIEADPLPDILLAGETLKVTGRLINGEKGLTDPLFREVVNLDIDFFSSNNKLYDNFGAKPIQIGTFVDDGRNFDEKSGDGIYTGEFVLDFAPGEWLPIYHVKMPMMSRELRQKPVVLQEAPVKIMVKASDEKDKPHVFSFIIDSTYVDPHSIILQGKIIYPEKEEMLFSILEEENDKRIKELKYLTAGIHRIEMSVFGKTTSGRDFVLTLPEFTFDAEDKNGKLVMSVDENGNEIFTSRKTTAEILAEKKAAEAKARAIAEAKKKKAEAAEQKKMYIIIGIVNAVVILVGLGIFAFFFFRKKKATTAEVSS